MLHIHYILSESSLPVKVSMRLMLYIKKLATIYSMIKNSFGNFIRERRKFLGKTQTQVVYQDRKRQSYTSRIEAEGLTSVLLLLCLSRLLEFPLVDVEKHFFEKVRTA